MMPPAAQSLDIRVVSALLGAVTGGLMSFCVFRFMNAALPRLRRWNLTRKLTVRPGLAHIGNITCEVHNGGFWTMEDAVGYALIEYDQQDVVTGPAEYEAHVTPYDQTQCDRIYSQGRAKVS
jgi:hypothetical protein